MACCFTKVLGEEIEEAFFYPSDLVNTKTTIPLRVGEERWIYTETLYIHHYSPPLREIVSILFLDTRVFIKEQNTIPYYESPLISPLLLLPISKVLKVSKKLRQKKKGHE